MKRFIISLFLLSLFITLSANATATVFSDLSDNHANKSAILYLQQQGIINGYPDGTFKPENTVNRAELLKILVEGNGVSPSVADYNNCFPDVVTDWYAPYVCYAQVEGWVQGYPDGFFRPAQTVNKVEALKMLLNSQNVVVATSVVGMETYDDVAFEQWFAPYVYKAKALGILEETGSFFSPAEGMRRAGICENLYRLLPVAEVPITSEYVIKSDFFSGDDAFSNVLETGSYDMNALGLLTNEQNGDKNTFAYKVFSAFKMLGYDVFRGYITSGNRPHILILNQFQEEYEFERSDFLTTDVLKKIDELLSEREQTVQAWAEQFPLYDSIADRHPNDYSKEHSAMLYWMPILSLPEYLQMTGDQYGSCISGQCAGDMNAEREFVDIYILEGDTSLWKDANTITTILHEYAHQLDGTLRPRDDYYMSGILDTRGFYDISYEGVIDMELSTVWLNNCFDRRTDDDFEFMTAYARESQGVRAAGQDCPPEKYAVAEDFAEAFAAYVASGIDFRAAAEQHPIIAEKYNWLKENVFQGVEYDTDLTWGTASGCNDLPGIEYQTPGYLRCDETYVWDGILEIL